MKIYDSIYEHKYIYEGIEFPIHCIHIQRTSDKTKDIHPQHHEYIEILYSLYSKAKVYINGKFIPFNSGDLLIINSGESHSVITESDASYIVIKVLPEILYSSEQTIFEMKYSMPFIIQNSNNKRYFTKKELSDGYIHDTITRIMNEWIDKKYGYELSIRADILRVFLWVLRFWREHDLDALDRFDYSDETLRVIQSALEYISKSYADVTARQLAEYCNLSYSYFSRTFKRVMGISFSEYLNRYRITKAEKLLCSTNKSISQIAGEVGFGTSSYFIEQFKNQKKISPKQYQIRYGTKNSSAF